MYQLLLFLDGLDASELLMTWHPLELHTTDFTPQTHMTHRSHVTPWSKWSAKTPVIQYRLDPCIVLQYRYNTAEAAAYTLLYPKDFLAKFKTILRSIYRSFKFKGHWLSLISPNVFRNMNNRFGPTSTNWEDSWYMLNELSHFPV